MFFIVRDSPKVFWAQGTLLFIFILQGQGDNIKPVGVVVSLGTGRIPIQDVKNVDVFRPEGILDAYKAVSGALSLSRMLIDQVKYFQITFKKFFIVLKVIVMKWIIYCSTQT